MSYLDAPPTVRRTRPRFEDWGVSNLVGEFVAQRTAAAVAPAMRNTYVEAPGDKEYTRGRYTKQYGKKQSAQRRLQQVAALQQEALLFNFKGIGRPFQYGFYNCEKFTFTDTEFYWALPLYALDITSINNFVGSNQYGHCPMQRAYYNQTANRIEWHICMSQNAAGTVCPSGVGNLTKSTPEAQLTSTLNSQWQIVATNSTLSSATNLPHQTQYIDTVDIYLNLFAARQVPTKWQIDVCQFESALAPYNKNNTVNIVTPEDAEWHTSFWMNEMIPFVNHPLNYQRGHRSNPTVMPHVKNLYQISRKGFRSLLGKPIIVQQQPQDTSFAEPSTANASRMHTEKITLKLRKLFNMAGKPVPFNVTATQPVGMDQSAPTTLAVADTGTTNHDRHQTTPIQSQRIFAIIRTNDYEDKAFNQSTLAPCRYTTAATAGTVDAWASKINDIPAEIATHVDFNKSGSFDINVFKRIIKEGI